MYPIIVRYFCIEWCTFAFAIWCRVYHFSKFIRSRSVHLCPVESLTEDLKVNMFHIGRRFTCLLRQQRVTNAVRPSILSTIRRCMASSPKKKARRLAEKQGLSDLYSPASQRARKRHPPKLKKISIAVVGRPNVGKSSLFNRLVRSRMAIVNSVPGTTRDIKEAEGNLGELEFVLLDTGGFEDRRTYSNPEDLTPINDGAAGIGAGSGLIEARMLEHTERAIRYADVVLFMVDAREGITHDDERFAQWLKRRRSAESVVVVANKVEGWMNVSGNEDRWQEFEKDVYKLRLGAPVPISAEHGEGILTLYKALEPFAIVSDEDEDEDEAVENSEYSAQQQENEASEESNTVFSDSDDDIDFDEEIAAMGLSEEDFEDEDDRPMTLGEYVSAVEEATQDKRAKRRIARYHPDVPVQMAIVGRPNVGKSTLVNQLVGEERLLTGPTPGLSRDSVAVTIPYDERSVTLIDTAGMRRYGARDLTTNLEGLAVGQAKKALNMANVVVVVLDASEGRKEGLTYDPITYSPKIPRNEPSEPSASAANALQADGKSELDKPFDTMEAVKRYLKEDGSRPSPRSSRSSDSAVVISNCITKQDLSIISQVLEEGRALVIALNKIDASPDPAETALRVREKIDSLPNARGVEIVPVSALRGGGVHTLIPSVLRTYDRWNTRIHTSRLNAWLQNLVRHHPPPAIQRTRGAKGKGDSKRGNVVAVPVKLKYIVQVNSRPPSFVVFCNQSSVPENYKRFLLNAIRTEFELFGTPIRMSVRSTRQAGRSNNAASPLTIRRSRSNSTQTSAEPGANYDSDETNAGVGPVMAQSPTLQEKVPVQSPRKSRAPTDPFLSATARAVEASGGTFVRFSRKENKALAEGVDKWFDLHKKQQKRSSRTKNSMKDEMM